MAAWRRMLPSDDEVTIAYERHAPRLLSSEAGLNGGGIGAAWSVEGGEDLATYTRNFPLKLPREPDSTLSVSAYVARGRMQRVSGLASHRASVPWCPQVTVAALPFSRV
jgi:hypothetical protein